jgi:hypothetical protein
MVKCNLWCSILCHYLILSLLALNPHCTASAFHFNEKWVHQPCLGEMMYLVLLLFISSQNHQASLHPHFLLLVLIHVALSAYFVWYFYEVRSFLQISRSIGDVYLKKPEYNREPLHSKFRLRETFQRPILSSEPQITEHRIQPNDQFVIFASDGLWEHLSNKEAVDLVQSSPRNVCFLLSHYNFYELKSTFLLTLVTVQSNWPFDKYILWIMLCFYWIAILLNW